ncbi:MAG: hypothetical protein NC335_01595 [Bacteroides sp.]|nr:hypothetical protein [Bacteroides sp.]
MKIKGIFNVIVATALAVAAISCEKGQDEPVIDSTIRVEGSKLVTMDSGASDFEIAYSVEGVHAVEAVTPSSDADWVSFDDEENIPGTINVHITENRTSEDRTAMVTLSLAGAKDVFMTVVQSANPDYKVDKALAFDLDVAEITSSTCFLTVNPNKQTSYFYHGVVTAEHYASYESDEAFIAAYVDAIMNRAGAEGKTIEPYLYKGYLSYRLNGLSPDSDYYLVAFDLSLAAEYSGVLAKCRFSTKPMTPSALDIELTVGENATVTARPRDGFSGKYALEVISLAMWNSYGDPKLAAEDFIEWANNSDYNISQFMHEGEFSAMYYNPNAQMGNITTGDYVAFAFGCDGARVTSGVSYVQFHFEEPNQ